MDEVSPHPPPWLHPPVPPLCKGRCLRRRRRGCRPLVNPPGTCGATPLYTRGALVCLSLWGSAMARGPTKSAMWRCEATTERAAFPYTGRTRPHKGGPLAVDEVSRTRRRGCTHLCLPCARGGGCPKGRRRGCRPLVNPPRHLRCHPPLHKGGFVLPLPLGEVDRRSNDGEGCLPLQGKGDRLRWMRCHRTRPRTPVQSAGIGGTNAPPYRSQKPRCHRGNPHNLPGLDAQCTPLHTPPRKNKEAGHACLLKALLGFTYFAVFLFLVKRATPAVSTAPAMREIHSTGLRLSPVSGM